MYARHRINPVSLFCERCLRSYYELQASYAACMTDEEIAWAKNNAINTADRFAADTVPMKE